MLCLAVGGAAGWFGHAVRQVPTVTLARTEPATDDAVAAFRTYVVEAVHPVEVRADEKPHLVTWLSKRLGRAVTTPDLTAYGFRLMGGRLLPAGSESAAMLMYDDDHGTTADALPAAWAMRMAARCSASPARAMLARAFSWVDGAHVLRRDGSQRRGAAVDRRAGG